jgi:hypothetical protein
MEKARKVHGGHENGHTTETKIDQAEGTEAAKNS